VAIVTAIQSVAQAVVSGEANFSKTSDTVRRVRGLLFPEIAEDTEQKASRTKELIEKEMSKGPMQVQRLDYGTTKRKKKR
jgi:hypothetical protein